VGATREKWLPIRGWPAYEVSDRGRVRSFNITSPTKRRASTAKILRPSLQHRSKYLRVCLYAGGYRETVRIHKLVADAFLGRCPKGLEVRHLDGKPANNKLANLKYGTPKENGEDRVKHGHTRRRTMSARDYERIRKKYAGGQFLQRELADEFTVAQSTISRVVKGRR